MVDRSSFVVLGFKDGVEVILAEEKVIEVAIKVAENIAFTQGYTRLRIAQVIINLSVEPKNEAVA